MLVRHVWIAWAKEQPDVAEHPNWLTEWADLADRDREVDSRIGMAVAATYESELAALRAWRATAEPLLRTLGNQDVQMTYDENYECPLACGAYVDHPSFAHEHAPTCPITLARALLATGGQG
jgi:hypothetical protein